MDSRYAPGTKVTISKNSGYYGGNSRNSNNPKDIEGTITEITDNRLCVDVTWSNGKTNNYDYSDLDIVEHTSSKPNSNGKTIKKSDIYEFGRLMYRAGANIMAYDDERLERKMEKVLNRVLNKRDKK